MRFKERDPSTIAARELMRVDVCWSVAFAMGMSDHVFGAAFQARAVLFALRAGEPTRVARALAIAAGYLATSGRSASTRVEKLLGRARELAERSREPHSIAYTVANSALVHYLMGRFRYALDDCDRAAAMFRDRVPGTAWERAMMQHFALLSLACLGQLAELQRRQPLYLRDALDRGDLYGSVCVRIAWGSLVWLARDDAEGLRREVAEAMASWSKEGCHVEHFYELGSRTNADLYQGRALEAYTRVEERLVAMRRALLLRIESVRVWTTDMRARSALALARVRPSERSTLLRRVEEDARSIVRQRAVWAVPLATLLRAGVAHLRGQHHRAVLLMREAIYGFDATGMGLHGAAARRRLARLVQGEEAQNLLSQTDEWFKEQQVVNPAALTAMVAPGYDD